MTSNQEIKDLLAVAAGLPTPGMNLGDFIQAAGDGDLAKVQLAVETHKLDPNCTDVSAPSLSVSRTSFHLRPLIALCHRCACACVASLRAMA